MSNKKEQLEGELYGDLAFLLAKYLQAGITFKHITKEISKVKKALYPLED